MHTRLIAIGFAAAVFAALVPAAAHAATAVTTGNVNLRAGPSTSYPVITTLPGNTAVEVEGCAQGWCKVDDAGTEGWMSEDFLEGLSSPPAIVLPVPILVPGRHHHHHRPPIVRPPVVRPPVVRPRPPHHRPPHVRPPRPTPPGINPPRPQPPGIHPPRPPHVRPPGARPPGGGPGAGPRPPGIHPPQPRPPGGGTPGHRPGGGGNRPRPGASTQG